MRRRVFYQSPRRRKIESISHEIVQINSLILILEKNTTPGQAEISRKEQLIADRIKLEAELLQVKTLK